MPVDSLDILRGLTSNVANPENPIQASLLAKKRLDDMKRNLGMVSDTTGGLDKWGNPTGTAFSTGATPTDVSGTEDDLNNDPYIGTVEKKRVADIQAINDALAVRNRPADTAARNEDFAQQIGLKKAPAEAEAAGALAVEQTKNQGLKDVLGMKQRGEQDLVRQYAGQGQSGSPNTKMTLTPSGPTFAPIPITSQTRQMSETANDILDIMDRSDYEGQAKNLYDKGLFAPVIGSVRKTAAQHGLGTLLGVAPSTASDLGQFETTHALLLSAIARAHAGARGAGNSELAARFEKILADQGDLPTFLGELKGVKGLLEQYANRTNPERGFSDTTSAPNSISEDPSDPAGLRKYLGR